MRQGATKTDRSDCWRHAKWTNSLPRRSVSLYYLVGELFDVLLKFFSCGPARQVKTDHLATRVFALIQPNKYSLPNTR